MVGRILELELFSLHGWCLVLAAPAAVVSWGRSLVLPWRTNVTLDCLVVGQPAPAVEWRHGDERLDPPQRTEAEAAAGDYHLAISNLQRAAEGNYSCQATNAAGTDMIVYSLQVQGACSDARTGQVDVQ